MSEHKIYKVRIEGRNVGTYFSRHFYCLLLVNLLLCNKTRKVCTYVYNTKLQNRITSFQPSVRALYILCSPVMMSYYVIRLKRQ